MVPNQLCAHRRRMLTHNTCLNAREYTMINLSNKAASRFRIKWQDLEERSGDFWKVEVVMFGRVPMLYIVHETTLFTVVRRKSQFRHPFEIAEEIITCCPWYRGDIQPSLGKNGNRRITGSINEIKRMTVGLFSPDQVNALEMFINNCIFSYLSPDQQGYGKPFEAVESYIRGQTPWMAL